MTGIGVLVIILGTYIGLHFTRDNRARGIQNVITNTSTIPMSSLTLSSSVFENNGAIPAEFTCDGRQVNPPLAISGVPEGTKSLALIMDDPDVPKQIKSDGLFVHWVLFNIPPETKDIMSGTTVGTAGSNGAGKAEYTGPCPPPQYEPSTHRYFFKLYALDTVLDLPEGASKQDVEEAMQGHILAEAQLLGNYKKK